MTTQVAPNRLDLPPPPRFDLLDAEHTVGWIEGSDVGFRGFADEHETASAAWVAHRTISRRLAGRAGIRSIPIDTEPLALARKENAELILASGRAIATLLRPGANSPSGADSFGFSIRVPGSASELTMRSSAYQIYRTLRKSGLPWAIWTPDATPSPMESTSPAVEPVMTRQRGQAITGIPVPQPAVTFVSAFIMMALLALAVLVFLLTASPPVRAPVGISLGLGSIAAGVVMLRRRRRRQPRSWNEPNGSPAGIRAVEVPGWATLGLLSAVILTIAFLVPAELGLGLLAVGAIGLFVFRIAVMHQR